MCQLSEYVRAKHIDVGTVVQIVDFVKGVVVVSRGQVMIVMTSQIVVIVKTMHWVQDWYRFTKHLFNLRSTLSGIVDKGTTQDIGVVVSLLGDFKESVDVILSLKVNGLLRIRSVVNVKVQGKDRHIKL